MIRKIFGPAEEIVCLSVCLSVYLSVSSSCSTYTIFKSCVVADSTLRMDAAGPFAMLAAMLNYFERTQF
jgi:hypothetical protein